MAPAVCTYLCPAAALTCVPQLRYLVETPANSDDPKRHFKYPFAACEVFCCEVEGIFNTLLENEDLLDQLFSIVQVPQGQIGGGWTQRGRLGTCGAVGVGRVQA